MKLTLNKDRKLEFYITDFFDELSKDMLLEVAESLSCEELIIKHVTDQILDGYTENVYCGATTYMATSTPTCALDRARREIAKRAGEVAQAEIERLEVALKRLEDEREKLYQERSYRRQEF